MAKGFVANIEDLTLKNTNFRKVLYTGQHSQLVLMTLLPSEEIGMEVHADTDQFFRVEKGLGKVVIDDISYDLSDGFAIVVPAGVKHNVINASNAEELKLYTIYSPAHHRLDVIHATKKDAEADKEEFDGRTSE